MSSEKFVAGPLDIGITLIFVIILTCFFILELPIWAYDAIMENRESNVKSLNNRKTS